MRMVFQAFLLLRYESYLCFQRALAISSASLPWWNWSGFHHIHWCQCWKYHPWNEQCSPHITPFESLVKPWMYFVWQPRGMSWFDRFHKNIIITWSSWKICYGRVQVISKPLSVSFLKVETSSKGDGTGWNNCVDLETYWPVFCVCGEWCWAQASHID